MNRIDYKHFLAFSLCFYMCVLSTFVCAETQKPWHFISFDNNSPNRPISAFEEDHMGYLWIGTFGSGLYRFDGVSYERLSFDWQDSTSINSNFIHNVFEDKSNRLWVGTEKGLNLYDSRLRKFDRLKFFDGHPVSSITEIEDGKLLVGTHSLGLVLLDPQSRQVEKVNTLPAHLQIFEMTDGQHGQVFLATNLGLFCYHKGQAFKVKGSDLLSMPMESVYLDKSGKLWIGTTGKGMLCANISRVSGDIYEVVHYPLTNARVMDIAETEAEGVWFATENDGIFVMENDTRTVTHLKKDGKNKTSLESNSIWALHAMDDSRVWLGYYEYGIGLYAPDYYKFESIEQNASDPNSLAASSVNGLVMQHDSILWVGMDGGGIDKYLISENRFIHANAQHQQCFSGLTNNAVQGLMMDTKGNLWVGCWDGGIFMLPKGSNRFANFRTDSGNGQLLSNKVIGFDEDKEGNIWIATFKGGVHKYHAQDKTITHLEGEDFKKYGLENADIRKVLVDNKGNIWIGATHGLFTLTEKEGNFSITPFNQLEKYGKLHPGFNNILSLFEDKSGNIWIGTDGAGLYSFNPDKGKLQRFTRNEGLRQETICALTEDSKGRIWITGKSGISVWNPSTGSFRNFSKNEGLLSNSFNYNAVVATSGSDKIYFGSLKGINALDISEEHAVGQKKVKTYLKNLRIFNKVVLPEQKNSPLDKDISKAKEIRLSYDQTTFTLDFTGIDFGNPELIEFAYYLEGPEKQWNYVGNQRSATYTSLKRGNYTFHLKAANSEWEWSEEVTLKIVILPPWYQSNWAIGLYVIAFLLGLGLLSQLIKMRHKEKEELRFERMRFRQQEELTQKKLQFFTNISHEFRTPLTLIVNPLKSMMEQERFSPDVMQKHNTIYRNAHRLKRLIDELLDFRKLNANNMKLKAAETDAKMIVSEVVDYFAEEARSRNIALEVVHDEQDYRAVLDASMVEKILFNLLSNAFKLTKEGGKIRVQLDTEQVNNGAKHLKLSVSDTGPGIAEDQLERIFERFYQLEQQHYYGGTGIGLEVVKHFVELHNGKVEVESELGKGTTFHLYFPLELTLKDKPFLEESVLESGKVTKEKQSAQLPDECQDNAQKLPVLLLVEDNYELRNYLKSELQNSYRLYTANNGREGLEKALSIQPDLIVTDVMMPEMDGFELCEKIKADIKTCHIPLLMLTAKSALDDKVRGIDTGADAYISKPFDIGLLRAHLRQLQTSRQVLFEKFFGGFGATKEMENTTSLDKDFLQKVVSIIHKHIKDPDLTVEMLADESSLSRSQLYRKVKALTGISATEFIRRVRLEEARKLIQAGNGSISDICYIVGFSSPSYFTKCYKSYFGVSPKQDVKNDVEA
ncbi:two-component regulator propeller domain-containing protein [Limibacter armeniacum]|uniref:two-component regulator propeller domain-containing protein n=1 Tax=Limibacter armeniacum TaxID=466084 RepID=UPI002FE5692B